MISSRENGQTNRGFTLVEIMIVVLIIGVLLAIAVPNFVNAREVSRAKACVGNLKQIDSATLQWSMDNQISATTYGAGPNLATTLVGTTGYIRSMPACPSGGTYAVSASFLGLPTCSIGVSGTGVYAPPNGATPAGRYYHGI